MMQAMRNPRLYKWGLYGLLILTIPAFVLFYGTPQGRGGGRAQIRDIEDAVTVRTPSGRRDLSLTYVQDAERELVNQYANILALQFGLDPQSPQGQQFLQQRAGQIAQAVTLRDAAEFAVGKAAEDDLAVRSGLRITRELVERDLQDNGVTAEQWRNMVTSSRMSERALLDLMKSDLQRTHVRGLVTNAARVSLLEAWLQHRLQNDLLTVQYAAFNAADYNDRVEITDEDVQAYFNENAANYVQPELITVNYIVVRPPEVQTTEPTEDEIIAYYESVDPASNQAFAQESGRRVRHIMVEVGGDEGLSAEDARARAEEARRRIVEGGEAFDVVANQVSTDVLNFGVPSATTPGPQLLGGLVERLVSDSSRSFLEESYGAGWFDAVSALATMEVSEVIEVDGAFYVARVEEEVPAGQKPLEQVRRQVVAALRAQQATAQEGSRREAFAETRQQLRLAREEASTLEGIAQAVGATVQSTPPISSERRVFDLIQYTGNLFTYRDYINGLREGMISDVLPATGGPEGLEPLVVLEIAETMPERPMSFDEAKEQARADLVRDRALELAKQEAEMLLALAQESASLVEAGNALGVEVVPVLDGFKRFEPPAPLTQIRGDIAQKSFAAEPGDVFLGTAVSQQFDASGTPRTQTTAYYVVRLESIEEPDQFEFVEQIGNIEGQLRMGKALSFLEEFRIDALRNFEPQYNERVFQAEEEAAG